MNKKQEDLAKVAEILTDSLRSHWQWTYGDKCECGGTYKFHKETIKEYLEALEILLKHL